MMAGDRKRHLLLFSALLATLLAVVFAPPAEDPVQPVRTTAERTDNPITRPARQAQTAAALGSYQPLRRQGLQDEPGELFQANRPAPPPAAESSPSARPRVPEAPALPYAYMGKMTDNGAVTLFLTRQDKTYVVKEGEILDGQYRVSSIRPPVVEFVYIPLGKTQVLNIGDAAQGSATLSAPGPNALPGLKPFDLQERFKQMLNPGAKQ